MQVPPTATQVPQPTASVDMSEFNFPLFGSVSPFPGRQATPSPYPGRQTATSNLSTPTNVPLFEGAPPVVCVAQPVAIVTVPPSTSASAAAPTDTVASETSNVVRQAIQACDSEGSVCVDEI